MQQSVLTPTNWKFHCKCKVYEIQKRHLVGVVRFAPMATTSSFVRPKYRLVHLRHDTRKQRASSTCSVHAQRVPQHGLSDCVWLSTAPNLITSVYSATLIPSPLFYSRPAAPPLFLHINRFACTFTPLFSSLFIFRSPSLIRRGWCRTQA